MHLPSCKVLSPKTEPHPQHFIWQEFRAPSSRSLRPRHRGSSTGGFARFWGWLESAGGFILVSCLTKGSGARDPATKQESVISETDFRRSGILLLELPSSILHPTLPSSVNPSYSGTRSQKEEHPKTPQKLVHAQPFSLTQTTARSQPRPCPPCSIPCCLPQPGCFWPKGRLARSFALRV